MTLMRFCGSSAGIKPVYIVAKLSSGRKALFGNKEDHIHTHKEPILSKSRYCVDSVGAADSNSSSETISRKGVDDPGALLSEPAPIFQYHVDWLSKMFGPQKQLLARCNASGKPLVEFGLLRPAGA